MDAVREWFTSLPKDRGRMIGLALVVLYVVATYSQAQDLGQFFNFTVIGIAEGAVFAIAASGLVVTYATTGVFNFAHGAVGMMAAFLYYALTVQHDVPVPIAMALILLVFAPAVGLLLELVMRRFKDAPIQTTVVVTIALTVMLIGVAQQMFPPDNPAQLPRLLKGQSLSLFGATPTRDNVAHLVIAVIVAIALRALLFGSRTGTAMRAVVDNPDLAALNGAPAKTIARYSWMLGSMLAALAGVLLAPNSNPLDPIVLTFFVAGAYGAAVVGKLKSLPLTFAGAIALGLIKNYATFAWPSADKDLGQLFNSAKTAIPGLFLFFALLLVPAAKLSVGRVVGRRAPAVPHLRSTLFRGSVFIGAVVLVSRIAPAERLPDMTRGMVFALLLLSLVLLTGFSGQVSLCQYVFMAMGAWAMGHVLGGNSVLGLLLAGCAAVPLGIIVALPALRLQGLYLALVTFSFADASKYLLLDSPYVFGKSNVDVGRLHLFGIDFGENRSFFVLCGIMFAAFGVLVLVLKRGPFGRRLAALRDSQAACATLGMDVRRTKLVVFAASAFIAGVAGALYGGLNGTAGTIQFEPINNIVLFLFAMVGGVTTISGAFIGGALFALLPFVQSEYQQYAGLAFFIVAFGAIALGRQPNGLAGLLYERLGFNRSKPSDTTTLPAEPAAGATANGVVPDEKEVTARATAPA